MKEAKKLIDLNYDICKVFKKTRGSDLIMPFVFKFIDKFGKVPRRCPIKAGEYYMYNATLKDMPMSDIPFLNYYFTQSQEALITFEASTKIKGKLIRMFNTTIIGGYRFE